MNFNPIEKYHYVRVKLEKILAHEERKTNKTKTNMKALVWFYDISIIVA